MTARFTQGREAAEFRASPTSDEQRSRVGKVVGKRLLGEMLALRGRHRTRATTARITPADRSAKKSVERSLLAKR